MDRKTNIGIYNPQLSSLETLESTLVKYDGQLRHWQHQITQSALHLMLIGPSGSGKTHLLRLLEQRIDHASEPIRALKLDLPLGAMSCYFDFLAAILTALSQPIDTLLTLPANRAHQEAERSIAQLVEATALLLLVEDFDKHLKLLCAPDKKQLGKLLKDNPKLHIAATASQQPDQSCSLTTYFTQQYLEPLSLDQAQQLMCKVAKAQDKADLLSALGSPKGRACLSAFHLFAQGIARYYVQFCHYLQCSPLEEFFDAIICLLDSQTQRYELEVTMLPPQQQKLLAFIAKQVGTVTVTDIAKYNRLSHQTTSGQLKKMRDNGLLVATAVGRTSHYELAQPLMRMGLAVRTSAIKQLMASIEFVRYWYASASEGYLAQDGQCFIFAPSYLRSHYLAKVKIDDHPGAAQLSAFLAAPNSETFAPAYEHLLLQAQSVALEQQARLQYMAILNSLTSHALAAQQLDITEQLLCLLFTFCEKTDDPAIWKRLAKHAIGFSAWFAHLSAAERFLPWLEKLERQEPKLASQAFSLSISHCLVNKAKGYSLAGEISKTQQALEQLRIRAEKRNNIHIAGAFCHAVKETMDAIAKEDEPRAAKLYRQVQDMSFKYPLDDLAFACAIRLWANCPAQMPLNRILKALPDVIKSDGFNYEVYLMLYTLAMRPLQDQIAGYDTIWQTLKPLEQYNAFASGLNRVSVSLVKHAPKRFELWLYGCETLLNQEPTLSYSKRLLGAMQQYLQSGQDDNCFLQLPQQERQLILTALAH